MLIFFRNENDENDVNSETLLRNFWEDPVKAVTSASATYCIYDCEVPSVQSVRFRETFKRY